MEQNPKKYEFIKTGHEEEAAKINSLLARDTVVSDSAETFLGQGLFNEKYTLDMEIRKEEARLEAIKEKDYRGDVLSQENAIDDSEKILAQLHASAEKLDKKIGRFGEIIDMPNHNLNEDISNQQ